MSKHKLHLLALSLTKGLGPVSVKNMIAFCGSAKAVFHTPKGKLMRAPGIGAHAISLLKQEAALRRAEEEIQFCEKQGIEVLSYLDEDYPNSLKYIYNAPLILFKKGKVDFNAQVNLAIVGTRQATERGLSLTEHFATFFAQKGCNVVSGLAFGIDIAAHRAAIKAGGISSAVLAHGLHTIYPAQHKRKAAQMLERGGILSEYLGGTEAEAHFFPARNRIVSGICKAVIVMEAARKGGALITARFAFEQDRQVYAIPGRPGDTYAEGCNRLIRDNVAKLLTDPAEVLEDLDIQWQQHEEKSQQLELALNESTLPLSAEEAKVLNFLAEGEAVIDKISQSLHLPLSHLNPLLLGMEFKDLVKQLPGKKYRKK